MRQIFRQEARRKGLFHSLNVMFLILCYLKSAIKARGKKYPWIFHLHINGMCTSGLRKYVNVNRFLVQIRSTKITFLAFQNFHPAFINFLLQNKYFKKMSHIKDYGTQNYIVEILFKRSSVCSGVKSELKAV